MQAIQFLSQTKELSLKQIPIPIVTRPNEVLVKVAFSGICGTDLHIIKGEFPCSAQVPITLGHEFCGTVSDVGCAVQLINKGDRVVVDPNISCHCCQYCHLGMPHFCPFGGINDRNLGINLNGGWAEYVLVTAERVHLLPDSITLEQAALTEPLSCMAHSWDLISPVRVGVSILIIGAGIIGNLFSAVLHLQGHRKVTVVETNQTRLNILKKLDTNYELLTSDELEKKQKTEEMYKFDLVIDTSGNPSAIEQGFSLLQRGGKFLVFGCAHPDAEIRLKPFDIFAKELTIIGGLINPYGFPKSLGIIESMGERYLNYEILGIQTFQLSDYKNATDLLERGEISKAMFKL